MVGSDFLRGTFSFWSVGLLFLTLANGNVCADSVHTTVTFDTGYLLACRIIPPGETDAADPPDQKRIEAKFEISSLVRGRSHQVRELLYRIESPRLDVHVVDYLPRTQMDTEYAGNVSVDLGNESSRTAGIGLAGNYQPVGSGNSQPLLSGDASASRGNKDTTSYQYELLPPLELVAASGTLQRGTGAFFKLKSVPRVALEGSRQFVMVMRVPQAWRAGYVRVSCEASAGHEGESFSCGRSRFLVALHLEADSDARSAAEDFVLALRRLQGLAAAKDHEIGRRNNVSFPRLMRVFSPADPKIPDNWLDQIMSTPPGVNPGGILNQLPEEVVMAAQKYRQAKADLLQLRR